MKWTECQATSLNRGLIRRHDKITATQPNERKLSHQPKLKEKPIPSNSPLDTANEVTAMVPNWKERPHSPKSYKNDGPTGFGHTIPTF